MKITFEDHSYIHCQKSDNPGKIIITISAKHASDNLQRIINSVEITQEQFKQLISDVQ